MITSEMVTKLKSLLPVVFLLISAFYGVPSLTPRARAATVGLVCIADQSLDPRDCPSSPANLSGAVGDTITVAVNVQGVDSLNGFDIWVQVNPAVLRPVSISLSDSLIQEPRFVLRQSANSTSGIARVVMVALDRLVIGSGDLFDVNYKVLSSSSGTPVTFMLGCFDSGSIPPDICVSVANPPSIVDVIVQTANFGPVTPDFSITAFVALSFGKSDDIFEPITSESVHAGFAATVGIILGSNNEFNGTVNLSVTRTPLCLSGICPSVSLDSTTQYLSSGGMAWTTVSFSAPPEQFGAPVTYWRVNVTATSGSISHTATITVNVLPPDFSIWWQGAFVQPESPSNATIFLRSYGGFGEVNLKVSQDCSASTCLLWRLDATTVTLTPGATAQTTLTYSAPSVNPSATVIDFHLNVTATATSNRLSHYTLVGFTVRDFNFTTNPSTLTIARGQPAYFVVETSNWDWVSFSLSISPDIKKGPRVTWPYGPCGGEHCFGTFVLGVSTSSTTHPGTYTVSLIVSNGWFTHTATLTLTVFANANDPKIH